MSCNCTLGGSVPTTPMLATTCTNVPTIFLFMNILDTFIRSVCDIDDPCNRVIPPAKVKSSYDFIVIGGGSGGSPVASRLSEVNKFSVLLLEAGLDEPASTQVPSFFRNYLGSDIDWNYETESEEKACLNKKDRKCTWPRGKVLGGSTVIHGMTYMRGSRKDYENWEKMGNEGWSYEDVLPFFIRGEDNLQIDKMDKGYHGVGGTVPVTQFPYYPPLGYAILEGAKELGYETVDLNGKNHTGFAMPQTNSKGGVRYSSAKSYLRPARNRKNLHIMLNSTATKIIFDKKKKAIGVEFFHDGKFKRVSVNKEVIVSGGTVNSPLLLLKSGIGSKQELEALNVPVIHDLPGVGKNLHNHVSYEVFFNLNENDSSLLTLETLTDYINNRNGPMSGTGLSGVTGFINTKYANPQEDFPDVQLFFNGFWADCPVSKIENKGKSGKRQISITPTILHAKSRGAIRLKDNKPLSYPIIYYPYFSHPYDMKVLLEGIKFTIRLSESEALKRYGLTLNRTPVKNCEHLNFGSDEYWECAAMHDTNPENHQAGSCKMGPKSDPMAVVDNKLKVWGFKNVRVADTSIMPEVITGNTNAPTVMIGERAADFIKKEWLPKKYEK